MVSKEPIKMILALFSTNYIESWGIFQHLHVLNWHFFTFFTIKNAQKNKKSPIMFLTIFPFLIASFFYKFCVSTSNGEKNV